MTRIIVRPLERNEGRPTWSVIIPTWNCGEYLRQTLQSVLLQDRGVEKMEIWVVDDFSTEDDPARIVNELGHGRVQLFRQSHNVGQLKNFETCLNLARGHLIHLLHGDDKVHAGFYEALEQPLLSDSTLGAGFVRHQNINEVNDVIHTSKELLSYNGVMDHFTLKIASKQLIQTPSIVVKREVYEKLGAFDTRLKWCEDWEMWIRISCNYRFYYSPDLLASYRIHTQSNSGYNLRTGKFITDILKCIRIYTAYLPYSYTEKKRLSTLAKTYYLNYAITISKKFKKQGMWMSALVILARSFPLVTNVQSLKLLFARVVVAPFKGS